MSTKSFIPDRKNARRAWFQSFYNNLDAAAGPLGLAPAMVAALKAVCQAAMTSFDEARAAKSFYASAVAANNAAVKAALDMVKNEAGIVKRLPGYDESIGASLGLIAPASGFSRDDYQAKILGVVNSAPGGEVMLRFSKAYGKITGVNVYYHLQGKTDWILLGLRTKSPVVFDTPLAQPHVPEVREYRIRAVLNDREIGLFSDPMLVTVS